MNPDTCKKCGRKIVWATMPSGKVNPFVKVTVYGIDESGQAVKFSEPLPYQKTGAFYISHFVDCPHAGSF